MRVIADARMELLNGRETTAANVLLAASGLVPELVQWLTVLALPVLVFAKHRYARDVALLSLMIVLNHFIGVLLRSLFGDWVPIRRPQDAMMLTTWLLLRYRRRVHWALIMLAYVVGVFVGLYALIVLDRTIAGVFGGYLVGAFVVIANYQLIDDAFAGPSE